MSVIGPRPGLWNQDILTAERDKYNANDVKPGLTGWAQINGRDELEIPDKAKLDGEYVSKMGLMMDIKCFLGSVGVFAHDDSVVEGGTGELHNEKYPKKAKVHEDLDFTEEKRVLVLFFLFISKTGILNKLLGTGIVGLIIWSSVTTAERTLVINFILCAFIYVYGKAFLEKKNKNVIKRLIKYTAIILLIGIVLVALYINDVFEIQTMFLQTSLGERLMY